MKYNFEIELEGKVEQASVEPVVYQDRHMYEVGINGRYAVIYRDGDEWKQEKDEFIDDAAFQKAVHLIESKIEKQQTRLNS